MASPLGSLGTFKVIRDETGSSIDVQISEKEGIQAENLSLSTWGASFVLANVLHKFNPPHVKRDKNPETGMATSGVTALELGAGTGLVGISAAAIWRSQIILTDLPSILPGLYANLSLNQALSSKIGSSVSCASLDWSQPNEIRYFTKNIQSTEQVIASHSWKADIILAADTIYSERHPELLSKTILTWLALGPRSRAILCYPLRMAYIDHIRDFWDMMEAAGLECLEEGREQGDENWNEVANTPYEWCIWGWRVNETPPQSSQ